MPYASVQANLPRFNPPIEPASTEYVDSAIASIPAADVQNIAGTNFRVDTGVFSFKNLTTGLYNRTESTGADGSQQIELANGTA